VGVLHVIGVAFPPVYPYFAGVEVANQERYIWQAMAVAVATV
jgi:hypothetical protein